MGSDILELPDLFKQKWFRTHKFILSKTCVSTNQIYSVLTLFELTLKYYLVYVVKLDRKWNGVL